MKKLLILSFLLMIAGAGFAQPLALSYTDATATIDGVVFPKNGLSYNIINPDKINILVFNVGRPWGNRPYTDFTYNAGSFPSRDSLISFLNANFFSDTSSSGNVPDLEAVTTAGNETSNSILVNGFVGYNPANTGLTLGYTSGIGILANNNPTFSSSILFGNDGGFRISTGNAIDGGTSAVVDFYPIENSGSVGAQFNCRIRGTDAFEASEYTTLSQVQNLPILVDSLHQGNSGSVLSTNTYHIYKGTDDGDFVLPATTGNAGRKVFFINDSAHNIEIQSNGGVNVINSAGSLSNSITMLSNQIKTFICSGTIWYVMP